LVATVVGSGIMAERLAGGNEAIALFGNTIPTGLWREAAPYILVQCVGGIAGTMLAHLMFDLAPIMIGTTARSGPSQWLAEAVATFTLVLTILGGLRFSPQSVPWLVGLVITAAYWFASSTSFANSAVTLARGFTTTFAGIAINHVPAFIAAQLIGAAAGALIGWVLFAPAIPSKSK
jgi:glycerol uptake facilitator-like aquaporin